MTGTGATDNAKFAITGNQLRTAASLSGQSTYSIRVRATDAAGLTFEQVITGTVTVGNVAPTDIALSNRRVAENTAKWNDRRYAHQHRCELGRYARTRWSVAWATMTTVPSITGNELKLATVPNFETKDSYSVRVQSTDNNGLSFAKQLTINVTNVNEAPTNVSLSDTSVIDGDRAATQVGLFTTTDPDSSMPYVFAGGGNRFDG